MTRSPTKSPPPARRKLGSTFQRGDGFWIAQVTLPTGKRLTRTVPKSAPDPRLAAERLLAALLTDVERGEVLPPAQQTVSAWLTEYLGRVNRGRAPATVQDRAGLHRHLVAGLGGVRLDRLTPERVQRWLDGFERSHRTKLKALQLLRSALQDAVNRGHLTRNVAQAAHIERRPVEPPGLALTPAQVRVLLRESEARRLHLLFRLAIETGARIGELLALEVSDYDRAARTLRIERGVRRSAAGGSAREVGPTKTVNGRRTFRLPAQAVRTVEAQLERVAGLRAAAGEDWQERGLLFPSGVGSHLLYRNVLREWQNTYAALPGPPVIAVPYVSLHDLRRTFITLALSQGVKPEVVARMVGHSSPLITLRIYRAIYDHELDEAAQALSGMY